MEFFRQRLYSIGVTQTAQYRWAQMRLFQFLSRGVTEEHCFVSRESISMLKIGVDKFMNVFFMSLLVEKYAI